MGKPLDFSGRHRVDSASSSKESLVSELTSGR